MWYWLQGKGVASHRSGIVQCLAEKCEIMPVEIPQNTFFRSSALHCHSYGPDPHSR